jgi:HAD superfamily hydrolase (TIGR01509 family)
VLVNSEPTANLILTRALNREGLNIGRPGVARKTRGLSMTSVVNWAEDQLGHLLPDDFQAEVQQETFAAFRHNLRAMPGADVAVNALKKRGYKICVASSGEHEKMNLTLGQTGLIDLFEGCLFSATEVVNGKPAPDLFLHAAREMGIDPTRTAVVEDSLPGLLSALRAGTRVFMYVPRGDGEPMFWDSATVFWRMAELPELIDGQNNIGV